MRPLTARLRGYPEFEVLRAVVVLHAVDVMDRLTLGPVDTTADLPLQDDDVLENHARFVGSMVAGHSDPHVPIPCADCPVGPWGPGPFRRTRVPVPPQAVVVHEAIPAASVLAGAPVDRADSIPRLESHQRVAVVVPPLVVLRAQATSNDSNCAGAIRDRALSHDETSAADPPHTLHVNPTGGSSAHSGHFGNWLGTKRFRSSFRSEARKNTSDEGTGRSPFSVFATVV